MTHFSAFFAALLGCSGGTDSKDGSSSSTSDTETSDTVSTTDSGTTSYVEPSLEVGPWMCPERTDGPEDFSDFKNKHDLDSHRGVTAQMVEFEAVAEAWVAPACLEGCTDLSNCQVSGCVTSSGAIVDYTSTLVLGSKETTDDGTFQPLITSLDIHVVPAGEPWTDLTYSYTMDRTRSWLREESWVVSWAGALDPRWPEDQVIDVSYIKDTYDGDYDVTWDDGDCVWSLDWCYDCGTFNMSVGRENLRIEEKYNQDCMGVPYAEATRDGFFLTYVHRDTWASIECI